MSTYNRLDLETLGYGSIMPKNLPGHCLSSHFLQTKPLSLQIKRYESMGSQILQKNECPGRFLDIIDQNPCVSKSNQLHIDILWFSFINLRSNP